MSGFWRKGFCRDWGGPKDLAILFPILEELSLYDPDGWIQVCWGYVTLDFDIGLGDYGQIREDFKKNFAASSAGIDRWFDLIVPACLAMKKMTNKPFSLVPGGWQKWHASWV